MKKGNSKTSKITTETTELESGNLELPKCSKDNKVSKKLKNKKKAGRFSKFTKQIEKTKKTSSKKWFSEIKSELKKVNWPPPKLLLKNTLGVFFYILIFGALVWSIDGIIIKTFSFFINRT